MKTQVNNIRDFDSLYELLDYFDSEEKCIDYLAQLRWNGQPRCPYCGYEKSYEINTTTRGKRWKCAQCHKRYSVRVGTIFEESKLPLRKWFVAIYLITAHRKGISSYQLARDLKITQKSAWFVLHRVRETFESEPFKLGTNVEIDETYVGGKEKNKHKSKRTEGTQGRSVKTKTPVLGIIERKGKIFAIPVKDTKTETILPIMLDVIKEGSNVYTDEWTSYKILSDYFAHSIVNHGAEEYVKGEAHTNNIESFWAYFKRGIYGIYHHVSDEHLSRYINESAFRFDNKKLTEGSKFDVCLANSKGRLSYKKLISDKV